MDRVLRSFWRPYFDYLQKIGMTFPDMEPANALAAAMRNGKTNYLVRGKKDGDYRVAMMVAIAATLCEGPVILTGAECVDSVFPGFWDEHRRLGGQAEEI